MNMFHSFPRPRKGSNRGRRSSDYAHAELVLRSFLSYGVLCTPETLKVFPSNRTENREKRHLLETGKPEWEFVQSRFCLTLCSREELFKRTIRGFEKPATKEIDRRRYVSHADLFGPCAVEIDALAARRMGVVPTFYYSPVNALGERYGSSLQETPGLSVQIIQRLKEVRELLIVLAHIERFSLESLHLSADDILANFNYNLLYNPEIMTRLRELSDRERHLIQGLFDTDRDVALNLIGFTEMMLSLFQETDSSHDGTPLAFYQQREWRLIYHMGPGLEWYSLGTQPLTRTWKRLERQKQIAGAKAAVEAIGGQRRNEQYWQHCWMLESIDGIPVQHLIKAIIVPAAVLEAAITIAKCAGCEAEIIAAEDYGYTTPEV